MNSGACNYSFSHCCSFQGIKTCLYAKTKIKQPVGQTNEQASTALLCDYTSTAVLNGINVFINSLYYNYKGVNNGSD